MKHFKKTMCLAVGIAMLAPVMACVGCGDDEWEDSDEVKVVKVWVHKSEAEDEGKVYSAIADEFNDRGYQTSSGKTVRLKLEFKNSADTLSTSINAEIIAGGLPDVVAVDSPNVAAYVDAGILQNISDYISEDVLADYVDSVIEQGTVDGGLYALSAMDAPTGLYYNTDLLSQVGYTSADYGTTSDPWTWDDLFEAMQKLKAAGLSYKIKLNLGFGGDEGCMYLYSPLVYSAGGSFFGSDGKSTGALDSDATINGLGMLERFFAVDTDGEAWYYNGSNEAALAQGEVAFEIHGPWNIATIAKEYSSFENSYDIMPMPVYVDGNGKKGTVGAGCGSWCFGVTTNTTDAEAAAMVVEFMTNAYSSELLYQSIGTYPTHISSFESITDFQSGAAKSLATILTEIATPRPVTVNYPKISSAFSQMVEYIETMYGTSEYDLKSYTTSLCVNVDAGL